MEASKTVKEITSQLITASHILHYHGICDAYGHISSRNPENKDTFFMPRNLAPALVSSEDDIVEYHISNAESVNPDAPKGYIERNIHAGIYRQYSDVHSVVHAHAEAVVAFSILPEGLFKPIYHMAGFLGQGTPTFDILPLYTESDQQDLLIRSLSHGDALSTFFSSPPSSVEKAKPDHSVVLMRGHGFTVAGTSIEESVYQASYTKKNAEILSRALAAGGGLGLASYLTTTLGHSQASTGTQVKYLTDKEAEGSWKGNQATVSRPWGLWKKEVEGESGKGGLYVNRML